MKAKRAVSADFAGVISLLFGKVMAGAETKRLHGAKPRGCRKDQDLGWNWLRSRAGNRYSATQRRIELHGNCRSREFLPGRAILS